MEFSGANPGGPDKFVSKFFPSVFDFQAVVGTDEDFNIVEYSSVGDFSED